MGWSSGCTPRWCLNYIKTGPSESCIQLGVADRLWRMLNEKSRQALVLAVGCSIASDGKPLLCKTETFLLFGFAGTGEGHHQTLMPLPIPPEETAGAGSSRFRSGARPFHGAAHPLQLVEKA